MLYLTHSLHFCSENNFIKKKTKYFKNILFSQNCAVRKKQKITHFPLLL